MKFYTQIHLIQGCAIYDYVRSAEKGNSNTIPWPIVIGILAAAMADGMTKDGIHGMHHKSFSGERGRAFLDVLSLFEGEDPRVHLWRRNEDGTFGLQEALFESLPIIHRSTSNREAA